MNRRMSSKIYTSVVLIISFIISASSLENDSFTFPEDFLFGTASSSYQIEGAWNVDGKGENIWDRFLSEHPEKIKDGSNGNVADDFYHKYKEDIALVKKLGMDHFRFSISWSRIFPDGLATKPNPKGVKFYHNILDELEKHGIKPFVSIYHWDHPQVLEKFGSWTNSYMAYVFADYARFIFQEYGSRVKLFITVNEPQIYCARAYAKTKYAPAKNMSDVGMYLCAQNMLKAHALAYHIYNDEFRKEQGGKVGIVLPCGYYYNKNESDHVTNNVAFEFNCGWGAHPIFSKTGDYPEIMKQRIAERSQLRGWSRSELPVLSEKWIKLIRGSSDFFGLNHYTSYYVEPRPIDQMVNWPNNQGIIYSKDSKWKTAQSSWLYLVPEGFGDILRKIKEEYQNPEIFVTECGVSDAGGIKDDFRIKYLYSYLKEMLITMKKDNVNVKAFSVWELLDSFEWDQGYSEQFGLIHVDFNSTSLTRTLKKSSSWLTKIAQSRRLVNPEEFYTSQTVGNALGLVQEAIEMLIANDPVTSRSSTFKDECEKAMLPYKELQTNLMRRAEQVV